MSWQPLPSSHAHLHSSGTDRKIVSPLDNKALAVANESGWCYGGGGLQEQWAARMFPGTPP